VLKWAREHDCPWSKTTCRVAASEGHLEVLKWAREHGCPWDAIWCATVAYENGHYEMEQWVWAQPAL